MSQLINGKLLVRYYLISIFVLLALNPGFSQENSFSRIRDLYRQFRFQEVIHRCQQQLSDHPKLTRDQQLFLNKYLVLSYFQLRDTSAAKITLRQLLTLDPSFRFSVAEASPKLISLLEEVRKEQMLPIREPVKKGELSVEGKDQTRHAALKSLLIPGWGQYAQGKRKRGILFFAAAAVGVSGGIYFHYKTEDAHQDYMNADEYTGVEEKFQRYKKFYRLRSAFIGLAVVSWLGSHVEAALFPPARGGEDRVAFYFNGYSAGIRFHFRIRNSLNPTPEVR